MFGLGPHSCRCVVFRPTPGFQFRKYPEGDLLDHVRQNQPFYLGCAFAILREWHQRGKARSDETGHDFREWVQVADWIVQHIFGMAPVIDGHREAQERVSDPQRVWLRQVVLAIQDSGGIGQFFNATDLHTLCENADLAIPGTTETADEDRCRKAIGKIMSKLFRQDDSIEVENFTIRREERSVPRDDGGGSYASKVYVVTRSESN